MLRNFSIHLFCLFLPFTAVSIEKKFYLNQIDTSLFINYYATDANFDLSGNNSYILLDNNSFEHLSTGLFLRWVPSPQWGLWTQITGAQATSYNNTDTTIIRTNRGLKDISLGGDTLLLDKPFRLIGDFSLLYPLQTVSLNLSEEDNALIGEGATEFIGKLIAHHFVTKSLRLYESVGFQYRNEQRASLLPWLIGFQYQWKRLSIGLSLLGSFSIINDSSPSEKRKALTDKVNAGSFKFFSSDPSIVSYSLNSSIKINKRLNLQGSFYQELIGSNHSKGYGFITSLQYSYKTKNNSKNIKDGFLKKASKRFKNKKIKDGKILKDFKEDMTIEEDYDDDLFKDNE